MESVSPAVAICRFFGVKMVELNFLTDGDIRELAPPCAKALGFRLSSRRSHRADAAEEKPL